MRTVKEISALTGISVRTLHYYDQIGLLKPTAKSEAGYRLYDDKALEVLRQILFFREFDIPLKEIRAVIENPAFDANRLLRMHRQMLVARAERIKRLIENIDEILRGEDKMDFSVFNHEEIEAIYDSMAANMNEEQKAIFIREHGSMDAFREHFMENALSPAAQESFRKVSEWYGGKEKALEASLGPHGPGLVPECQRQMEETLKKLAGKRELEVHSPGVREFVAEYDAISREMYQLEDVSGLLLDLARLWKTDCRIQEITDSIYGKGATEFFGRALEAFYTG